MSTLACTGSDTCYATPLVPELAIAGLNSVIWIPRSFSVSWALPVPLNTPRICSMCRITCIYSRWRTTVVMTRNYRQYCTPWSQNGHERHIYMEVKYLPMGLREVGNAKLEQVVATNGNSMKTGNVEFIKRTAAVA